MDTSSPKGTLRDRPKLATIIILGLLSISGVKQESDDEPRRPQHVQLFKKRIFYFDSVIFTVQSFDFAKPQVRSGLI